MAHACNQKHMYKTHVSMESNSTRIEQLLAAESTVLEQIDHAVLNSGGASCAPNLVWREKVAQWCYDVADHFDENRSVIYVAMNILDRYCAILYQQHECVDEKVYELSSITAVFLAVRFTGSGNLRLQQLASMSQGGIQVQDVISKGTDMVKKLTWDHLIVTPFDFVTLYLEFLPSSTPSSKILAILQSATYLIEISVYDIFLSRCKASEIALAAILEAPELESDSESYCLDCVLLRKFAARSHEIASIRNRLQSLYRQSADSIQSREPHLVTEDESDDKAVIPRRQVVRGVSKNDWPVILRKQSTNRRKKRRWANFYHQQCSTGEHHDVPQLKRVRNRISPFI